ncbi:MAG: type I 3-dehydroquinate dehydratase [Planctomycetes bacterium]|nr:type I 3-dehydroquinate dehydratase [Planctomycetota bacterium]
MFPFETPAICAVIGRTRHKMMQAEIAEAGKQGARLIELRLDFLSKPPDFKRLLDGRPCPLIATFRRPVDGGQWRSSEDQRLMLIRQAIVAGFDYVDLESDIIDKIPRFGRVKRIVSYHNIREVPANLEELHRQMCAADADVVKIVVTAQSAADNLRLLALLKDAPKPTVAFCMGDLGVCSRVLGVRLGMPYTYGAFNKERQIAPGILSFTDLQKTFGVERINPDTKVFGVIGDPIGHSLSPLIHNAAFKKLGINAVYVPFRVPRGELPTFLTGFQTIPVQGYSVTLPHKEGAAKFAASPSTLLAGGASAGHADPSPSTLLAGSASAGHADPSPSTLLAGSASAGHADPSLALPANGAANTLIATPSGFRAYNTDAQAALDSLQANLPLGSDNQQVALASRKTLILGAGGVARAIAFALHQEGVYITITNRTDDRGQKLAEEVGCKFVTWPARHQVECDLVINCTSVGMTPNLDEMPVHQSFLIPERMIFDTIYTPETTMLIREARIRGAHTLTGVDMFVRQAGLQFELFTGQAPPLDLMAAVVRKALSPVHVKDDGEVESAGSNRVLPGSEEPGTTSGQP